MAPCFGGISLRTGTAVIGIIQLIAAAAGAIYFALLVTGTVQSTQPNPFIDLIKLGELTGASVKDASKTYDIPVPNTELKILSGISGFLNLILGTILSFGVLTNRKRWCKVWVWISVIQLIVSLIVTLFMLLHSFWIGLLWVTFLLLHVWFVVVVYEFTNEKEDNQEMRGETNPIKIVTEV